MSPLPPQLRQLARLYGVQLAYRDGLGRRRRASADALLAVLKALGAPLDSVSDAAAASRARRMELARRRLDPVAIAWDGEGAADLLLPSALRSRSLRCRLEPDPAWDVSLRDGKAPASKRWTVSVDHLPVGASAEIEGEPYLTVRLPLPGPLPIGRYRLRVAVTGGARAGEEVWPAAVVSAPARLPSSGEADRGSPRHWGVFLPLYSLHSEASRGIGTYSDLGGLRRWAQQQGAAAVATLPLSPTFLDEPFDPSPYAPVSRLFTNELHLDLDRLPGVEPSDEVSRLTGAEAWRAEQAALVAAERVDPCRQWALQRPLLAAAAGKFFAGEGALRDEFEAFRREAPQLDDYAVFRALCDRRRQGWPAWPEALRDAGGSASVDSAEYAAADADLYRYAQWAADRQLTAAAGGRPRDDGCGLMLDLPLGVHGAGYDPWAYRELFVPGVAAGAPPDALCTAGQDWGFAPLHPERQREAGYQYFAACLRRSSSQAKLLRIDHVMHLHRLFWVPSGMGAEEGVYVRYPAEELYAVLCCEAARAGTAVVGENLGTVPGYVDAAMRRRGLLGMYVAQHSLEPRSAAGYRSVPRSVAATLGTHDMPPFAAFVNGDDLPAEPAEEASDAAAAHRTWRREQVDGLRARLASGGLLSPGERPPEAAELAAATLESLGTSRAAWVVAALEDLWGERRPQNVPGTQDEHPNWRRRAALSLERIRQEPRVSDALRRLDRARKAPAARGDRPPPRALGALSADDGYLFAEGRHFRLFDKLGAHAATVGGQRGTRFAVWAPHARQVSVIGDFNDWNPGTDPLAAAPAGGGAEPDGAEGFAVGAAPGAVWEGFVAGARPGQRYKFRIEPADGGEALDKADPFAFCAETPPDTASVIWDLDFPWGDAEWMAARAGHAAAGRPVSIYEVHLGSWRRVPEDGNRPLSYRELAPTLCDHVKRLGFTHVELLPVTEHPFYGSWGYQATGYFAATRRYGDPQDLMGLIDHLHREGIGVILDWVPSHFPADPHGLGEFDGTRLFEYSDPREGYHPDWKSLIFDYARGEVRSFLISSALFWLERYHVDGLRVDAVASMLHRDYSRGEGEWVPNVDGGNENLEAIELLRQLNDEVHRALPGVVTFAEESTAWPGVTHPTREGGLGFDYKWDLGWMNDTLTLLGRDPVHRSHHWEELTFRAVYAFSERYCLPLSHDEVVHGKGSLIAKMFGDDWQQRAQLRLLYGYQWLQPGKKLLFMGGEIGSRREWDHDSSLDWHLLGDLEHDGDPGSHGLARWLSDLNRAYRELPALWRLDDAPATFRWSVVDDAEAGALAFLRFGGPDDRPLLAACNLTPLVRYRYPVALPLAGSWREILNSDAETYGGSGVGNLGEVAAVAATTPAAGAAAGDGDGQAALPAVGELTLPPLGMVVLEGPQPLAAASVAG